MPSSSVSGAIYRVCLPAVRCLFTTGNLRLQRRRRRRKKQKKKHSGIYLLFFSKCTVLCESVVLTEYNFTSLEFSKLKTRKKNQNKKEKERKKTRKTILKGKKTNFGSFTPKPSQIVLRRRRQ